jgi:hypothetical protein
MAEVKYENYNLLEKKMNYKEEKCPKRCCFGQVVYYLQSTWTNHAKVQRDLSSDLYRVSFLCLSKKTQHIGDKV